MGTIPAKPPIVIIGNGAAAVHAVRAIRESGCEEDIHLFADSTWPPYNPMLTTYFVAGKITLESCFPFGTGLEFYQSYKVHVHLGSPVVEVDTVKQEIRTGNGASLRYSRCLVASGASPYLPPVTGIKGEGVYTMRTLEDALRLRQALKTNPRRALVVGASMVGIKLVELFYEAGVEVCLADLAPQVFPLAAHPDCARIIEGYLEGKGIKLRLGAGIKGIETAKRGLKAYFSGHEAAEEADLAVIAIGVRPNLQFLDPAQVKIDKGLVVDDRLRTSAPNLYAAGDAAQGTNLLSGEKEIIGLWANARYQGRAAGRNMAGTEDYYPGSLPHNITHFLDMVFVGIGDMRRGEREEKIRRDDAYLHLVWEGERLKGVNLLNCYRTAGVWKQILINQNSGAGGGKRGGLLPGLAGLNLPEVLNSIPAFLHRTEKFQIGGVVPDWRTSDKDLKANLVYGGVKP